MTGPQNYQTFEKEGIHEQHGIAGSPLNLESPTPAKTIFYSCHNGSTYSYKDFGDNYFSGDFEFIFDFIIKTYENNCITFLLLLSNDHNDAHTLKKLNKYFFGCKVKGLQINLFEKNVEVIESSEIILQDKTKYYLRIFREGLKLTLEIYSSSEDRDTKNPDIALGTTFLDLQENYSFKYLISPSSWFIDFSREISSLIEIENLEEKEIIPASIWNIVDEDFCGTYPWEFLMDVTLDPSNCRCIFKTMSLLGTGLYLPNFIDPYPIPDPITVEVKFKPKFDPTMGFGSFSFKFSTDVCEFVISPFVDNLQINGKNYSPAGGFPFQLFDNISVTLRVVAEGTNIKVWKKLESEENFTFVGEDNIDPTVGTMVQFFFWAWSTDEAWLDYIKIGSGIHPPI